MIGTFSSRYLRRVFPACAITLSLLTGACSTPEGYPSLAIRDSERVSGSFEAPERTGFTPTPATPATLAQLDSLAQSIRDTHQRFLAAAQVARAPVRNATGSTPGMDNWSQAQVQIANLESIRSSAMVAMADIDRLYVEAATSGGEVARLEEVRGEASGLIAEEDRQISEMLTNLRS